MNVSGGVQGNFGRVGLRVTWVTHPSPGGAGRGRRRFPVVDVSGGVQGHLGRGEVHEEVMVRVGQKRGVDGSIVEEGRLPNSRNGYTARMALDGLVMGVVGSNVVMDHGWGRRGEGRHRFGLYMASLWPPVGAAKPRGGRTSHPPFPVSNYYSATTDSHYAAGHGRAGD